MKLEHLLELANTKILKESSLNMREFIRRYNGKRMNPSDPALPPGYTNYHMMVDWDGLWELMNASSEFEDELPNVYEEGEIEFSIGDYVVAAWATAGVASRGGRDITVMITIPR